LEDVWLEQSELGEFLRILGKDRHRSVGSWEPAVGSAIAVRAQVIRVHCLEEVVGDADL